MIQPRIRLLLAPVVMILGSTSCPAELFISNILLTPTSLSFDVRGTIDVVGTKSQPTLFFGEPFNSTWIAGGMPTPNGPITVGEWTHHSGSYYPALGAVHRYEVGPSGAYVYSYMTERSIVVGDTVDMSFSVVSDEAFLIPAYTDTSKWIVSAGYYSGSHTLPEPFTKTGYAIPEPTALALAAMLVGCCLMRRRPNH